LRRFNATDHRRPRPLRTVLRLLALAVTAIACLTLAAPLGADTPPNPTDPCTASGPRDSCGTTGVGQYATYRYGTRWFGNYQGAIKGVSAAGYCIDLGYWYPSASYGYTKQSAEGLHNRRGGAVSDTNLHEMAYALEQYGQTSSSTQASAVMLYVHSLMGDAQPGEVNPSAVSSSVASTFTQISAASAKFAGPYTIHSQGASAIGIGGSQTVTFTVQSASGATVTGVNWRATISGAKADIISSAAANGTETVTYKAGGPGTVTVHASASNLASNLPTMYVPTQGAAAQSGQRLVVGDGQTISSNATATASLAHLTLTTTATPGVTGLGATNSDAVTLSGEPAGTQAKVTIAAYGPASSATSVSCSGTPAFTQTFSAGDGTTNAPAFTPAQVGYYAYKLTIAPTASSTGVTTACGGGNETFVVMTTPAVHTVVSAAQVTPGSQLSDTVDVTGLDNQTATVTTNLYGPFTSGTEVSCAGDALWTGTIPVQADGTYQTAPTTLTVPGYYVYNETIAAGGFVQTASTNCSTTDETTLVPATPTVTTKVSSATAAPGSQISDTAVVSGLGIFSATVDVKLYGPYATKQAIDCSGTPLSSTTLAANGDGSYTSQKVTLPSAGYYTFNESIAATADYPAVSTPCAAASETTFAQGSPQLATQASDAVIEPGSTLTDHVKVSGLGTTPATVNVDLYGPYASLAQVNCSGSPAAHQTLAVKGDGSYDSPSFTVSKIGFYVFRESIAPSANVSGVQTQCADTAETSLAAPAIITGGRGPFPHQARQTSSQSDASTPTQVQIPALDVQAPVQPITIDLALGQLGVPSDIHHTGWWRDGAAPGDAHGTVLIAGHVDSAAAGAGAFFPLPHATRGDLVTITTRSGATVRYRVTSVERVLKANLPDSVFDRSGPARLALVTCGGPFDYQTGHYLDNIIVWGTPV
jgi:hypothetical protein